MSYASGASAMGSASQPSSSSSGSRSKRELIDKIRYTNPIPLPPYPPKLVKINADPSRYANPHFADRLAAQHPFPMIVDAHAGMPIDLANFQNIWEGDLSEVVVGPNDALDPEEIDDADAFLLQEFSAALPSSNTPASFGAIGLISSLHASDDPSTQASVTAATQYRQIQSLGPAAKTTLAAADVTWLRRTEYLSSEQKKAQQVHKPRQAEKLNVSREAQLAKIERSFQDAQKPLSSLVHPTKRGIKAVQSFELLPDPETWATNYQVVRFIDPPGRIVNGVPVVDPRLDVSLFRPVSAGEFEEQRVSYYLPTGEDLSDDLEVPLALIDNQDLEDQKSKRLRKRRRTGQFPLPKHLQQEYRLPVQDQDVPRKDYATAYKWIRDYVPRDARENPHDLLVLTLDDDIPDADPDANVDPLHGVKRSSDPFEEDDADDLFGDDDDDNDEGAKSHQPNNEAANGTKGIETTLPPQSEAERRKRAARNESSKGKEKSDLSNGFTTLASSSSVNKPRAYYHKVGMRVTLRVWRSRLANNEKLRNRDRRYPGKWDVITLTNRPMTDREQLRRLHLRGQVDDLGTLDAYESSEGEEDDPTGDGHEEEQPDDLDLETDNRRSPQEVDDEGSDEDQESKHDRRKDHDEDDQDEEETNPIHDGESEDEEDDDAESIDADEELAGLRKEAEDAGDELDGKEKKKVDVEEEQGDGDGSRSRRSRRAAATVSQNSMKQDHQDESSQPPQDTLDSDADE